MKGIMNVVNDGVNKLGRKLIFGVKKASPELLIIGGIGCLIGGTVMAVRAVDKAKKVVDKCEIEVNEIKEEAEKEDCVIENPKKEIAKVKLEKFGKVVMAYAPGVALGGAGIAMIFTSHGIMKKRNGALLASYNALSAMFQSYRNRILMEEDGEERDKRYCLPGGGDAGGDWTDESEGQLAYETRNKAMSMARGHSFNSPYIFEFSKYTSRLWNSNEMINLSTIRSAETNLNLQKRYRSGMDCVTLADGLRELGMDPMDYPWSLVTGWKNNGSDGDDSIRISAVPMDDGSVRIEFNCEGFIMEPVEVPW